ncbi:SGNH/GDSL hydrolase family protein [Massilia luteola]|uniref:SGNH/GDSL hydrolase family protein n=1 Tax=Massilia luteola TaxID=3081751 RepID=UPI002ACBF3BB|nr:SGNH/GDSL hydrolase family protein [Massilia sp. Gc5]
MKVRTTLVAAGLLAAAAQAQPAPDWIAAWGTALMAPNDKVALAPASAAHATLRQAMRLSLGGTALRVRISNRFGDEPLAIGAATVGRARAGAGDLAGSPLPLRFGGKPGVTVAPGAEIVSDPLDFPSVAGDLVAVSLAVEALPARQSVHIAAHATQFLAPGDQAARPALDGARALTSWYQVDEIDVLPSAPAAELVAIGDSITDGTGAGLDRDERWPDYLQRRLRATHAPALAVVNAGIGGNRMLADGNGPKLAARFAHDVLDRPGVTHALVLIGVNDLGVQHRAGRDTPDARRALLHDLEDGWTALAAQAHARGVCLIAGTIVPYGGSRIYQPGPDNEADRLTLNAWLRASPLFDGVADFDAALRDPDAPGRLREAFDSGDRLHPSPAGYRAMAAAVPLDRLAACRWRPQPGGTAPPDAGTHATMHDHDTE